MPTDAKPAKKSAEDRTLKEAWEDIGYKGAVSADAKPAKRIVDRYVYVLFHDRDWACLSCGGGRQIVAHHIIRKSQGGDDVMANLAPLCDPCHGAYHGTPYKRRGEYIKAEHVRQSIARYIRSEDGEDTAAYLIHKLGPFTAEHFVQKMEGE